MKKFAVAFLFCLISTIANAQPGPQFRNIPKPVLCGPLEVLFKGLADEEVNEKPIWIGKAEDEKSEFAVFVNRKTGAFTLVQFGKEWGCILGIGYSSRNLYDPA